MGFRFRRSLRLAPGLRINLSKSGASLSVGGRGATVNFGPRGTRLTVGLPGTGLSYSTKLGPSGRKYGNARESDYVQVPLGHVEQRSPGAPFRLGGLGWVLAAGICAILGLGLLGGGENKARPTAVASAAQAISPTAAASEPAADRETVEIAAPANIREEPRPEARVLGVAPRHERYSVFGRSGTWTEIGKDAVIGWVGNSRLVQSSR